MELYRFRWNAARAKYLEDLQANGLIRWASMQIWNKQGKSQLGWLFEYSDPEAYENANLSSTKWKQILEILKCN